MKKNNKKKNKRKKKYTLIIILIILLIFLITYYLLFLNKPKDNSISQNITVLPIEDKVNKKRILTPNKEENLVITPQYILLGNIDILRINDDRQIKQVTVYNNIILVMIKLNDRYKLDIYDFMGNIKKEIYDINSESLYYLTNISNSQYYFNVSGNTITIMGTKIDKEGKYILENDNHIDLCTSDNINDNDIASATFTFTYKDDIFSDIKFNTVATYIKDKKKCNN